MHESPEATVATEASKSCISDHPILDHRRTLLNSTLLGLLKSVSYPTMQEATEATGATGASISDPPPPDHRRHMHSSTPRVY